jgi:hypothetical protein
MEGYAMRILVGSVALALLFASAAATPAMAGSGSASTTGSSSAKIIRPISVTKNKDLNFGTIVAPTSGSAAVNVSNLGVRTTTLDTASGAVSNADFTINGEAGQAITVNVDASYTITDAASDHLTVTTNATDTGTQTLSGTFPAAGSLDVPVSGSITVSSTTPSGAYTGTFNISTSYN